VARTGPADEAWLSAFDRDDDDRSSRKTRGVNRGFRNDIERRKAVRDLIHFWRSLIARGSGMRWTAALWLPLLRSGRACSNGEPLRFASWYNWADLEALLSGRPISVDRAPIARADLGVSYVLRTEPEVMANILDRV
jgi:hypothetical protein